MTPRLTKDGIDLKLYLKTIEVYLIIQALSLSNNVAPKAAKLLGLKTTTLIEN
jgi:transcriptional regulator with PAS, ATPase and Fis domain